MVLKPVSEQHRIPVDSAHGLPKLIALGYSFEQVTHALLWLRKQGYVVVARNYRSPRRRGEIDLVGWDGDVLCFIEVKTRTSHDVKPAEAAVDHEKRKELRGVARKYLRRMRSDPVHRFDVVSIYLEKASGGPIELFKNAFPVT